MQAIVFDAPGPPSVLHLAQVPLPIPAEGEVLVRVHASGVNRPDIMQRKGLYPPPPGASPLLGLEIAGEVVATGPAARDIPFPAKGSLVCALTNGGGYADYCTVPAGQCLPWPTGFDAVKAAALPETFFTVWSNLFTTARLQPGERVLIHGGAGGIGTAAIQLARAFDAIPYATAGSKEKCQLCESLGATSINYNEEDFVAKLRDLTDGKGVNVILDILGGKYLDRNLRSLARHGRLILIALQSGAKAENVDISGILTKNLTIEGTTLRPRSAAYKAAIARDLLENVWPRLASGEIAPLIHATFPISEAAEAHTLMETGSHSGKIVLLHPASQ
ncbi:NAD(P)H-quinone oxidoreductase [Acetobacter fallax]|uniref:Zinc-binding dehydrogenase n=1 Tax=Acetobacter fallax TaxID=1737473 RepID=A0ABX0K4U1_9PROT|nr:NAD(P)H-quinone oxidoreductase [Acetobacter fallax]NHO31390.1 zinc-binding dehydrogenase [Acetobacter fallax]NHO35028.1 zinc-binding dehydrogenase [Acetobacter fallax]